MAISTSNVDAGSKSPRAARVQILDVINAINSGVPVDLASAFTAGTMGAALQDGMVNVLWFFSEAERAQVKANGTTLDLKTKIDAAVSFAGSRPLYFPAGTYSYGGTFDGKGWYGAIVGDGMGRTIIKQRTSATSVMFDFAETSDVQVSPFRFLDVTIDGDNKATTLIDVRYRHHYRIERVMLTNAGILLNAKDSWLNEHVGCRFTNGSTLVYLRGSNHRNLFQGCAFSGNTAWQLLVEPYGTAADGNESLYFANCDFEFSGTGGTGIYFLGTSATFACCYIGENMEGTILQMQSGIVEVHGGAFFFGHTEDSIGVKTNGGRCRVMGTRVNGQTNGSLPYLMDGSGGTGTVQFVEIDGNIVLGGDQVVKGAPLGYGPGGITFAKRLGRAMTGSGNHATVNTVVVGNQLNVACASVSAGTPNITVTNMLDQTRPEWREGEALYQIVVYQSNAEFKVRLSGGALGASPTQLIGTMPATGGETMTYIKLDTAIPSGDYDRIEYYRDDAEVTDSISMIYNCTADSRMLNAGSGTVGNLCLC